jgi:hypothetical protein
VSRTWCGPRLPLGYLPQHLSAATPSDKPAVLVVSKPTCNSSTTRDTQIPHVHSQMYNRDPNTNIHNSNHTCGSSATRDTRSRMFKHIYLQATQQHTTTTNSRSTSNLTCGSSATPPRMDCSCLSSTAATVDCDSQPNSSTQVNQY